MTGYDAGTITCLGHMHRRTNCPKIGAPPYPRNTIFDAPP